MHFPEEAFVAHGHPESLITHEGSSAANTDVVRMMDKAINENMWMNAGERWGIFLWYVVQWCRRWWKAQCRIFMDVACLQNDKPVLHSRPQRLDWSCVGNFIATSTKFKTTELPWLKIVHPVKKTCQLNVLPTIRRWAQAYHRQQITLQIQVCDFVEHEITWDLNFINVIRDGALRLESLEITNHSTYPTHLSLFPAYASSRIVTPLIVSRRWKRRWGDVKVTLSTTGWVTSYLQIPREIRNWPSWALCNRVHVARLWVSHLRVA